MYRTIAITLLIVGVGLVGGSSNGCRGNRSNPVEKERLMAERTIEQVQEAHTDAWMAIPGVEGTAIGLHEGEVCIKIFSSRGAEELRGKIPSTVEGYPVVIEETGTFRALEEE